MKPRKWLDHYVDANKMLPSQMKVPYRGGARIGKGKVSKKFHEFPKFLDAFPENFLGICG